MEEIIYITFKSSENRLVTVEYSQWLPENENLESVAQAITELSD